IAERSGARVESRCEKIRARVYHGVRHRLCQLGRRQPRQFRRGHAGRAAKVRHQLVAASEQRRWVNFALVAGLIIANVFPRFAETIKEAVRPELYIKIAIVILGGFFAVTAAGKLNLATSLLLRGVAAIIEAYLIYWAVVYFVARKWFGFNREWAAPLA